MPHHIENKCCLREPLDRTHIPDREEGKCLLRCENIAQVIGRVNVQMAWMRRMRVFGHTGPALNFDNMTNNNYRYWAYRNYIEYIYGLLGRYNRKVVPACVVSHIRATWPDTDGEYVGFQAVDEMGAPIDMDELLAV